MSSDGFECARSLLALELIARSPPRSPASSGDVDLSVFEPRRTSRAHPGPAKVRSRGAADAAPPFARHRASPTGGFKRLFISPGPIFEGEDHGDDPYGAKAAFVAAGVAPGEIVLNCFSYHLTPGGFISKAARWPSAARSFPPVPAIPNRRCRRSPHLKPSVYAGPPDFLKIVLDKAEAAGRDVSSIRKALVSGAALPPCLRAELEGARRPDAAGIRDRRAWRHRL